MPYNRQEHWNDDRREWGWHDENGRWHPSPEGGPHWNEIEED